MTINSSSSFFICDDNWPFTLKMSLKQDEFLNLSKYKQESKIGQGSFGRVYKVIEETTGEVFAAKISLFELGEDLKSLMLNLMREVNIISQLNHPSILKFIGYSPIDFDNETKPVIITEYSPNGSLENIIKLERQSLSPPSWNDTKKLINIYGIASAMSYLHSHDIIHRDLKSANILEDDYLFPKIADFGLSKNFHQNQESMSLQSTACVKGTPIYIAPEIWQTNEYTKAGDVYAFSFIMYELLTLEEPFKGFTIPMLLTKVLQNNYRPEFKYPIADCYSNLINRCWSSDPSERPTFEYIVDLLKNNDEFITDSIDKDEFLNYVDLIDNYDVSFEPNKKFSKIVLSKQPKKVVEIEEQSIIIYKEKVNEQENINLVQNQEETSSSIYNEVSKINGFNNLLEETQELFKNSVYKNKSKIINIKSNKAVVLYANDSFSSPDLFNVLKYFDQIVFDLKYPAKLFDQIFDSVLKLVKSGLKTVKVNLIISDITGIEKYVKIQEPSLTVVLDQSVTVIEHSFEGCSSLIDVTIPESVTKIGYQSFDGCSSLKEINIPSSVAIIGHYAFKGCSSLTEVLIPPSVTSLGTEVFGGCSSLTKVTIPPSVNEISMFSFMDCSALTQINIPSSITTIGGSAFKGCTSLNEILIPTSVVYIDNCAFENCSSLKQIAIPSSMTLIRFSTFSKCSSLMEIKIPSSVTSIENSAFYSCSSLEKVSIPSSVVSFGESAFDFCSSLKEITIPSSITTILSSTFEYCKSLTQIIIPGSVTAIERSAFGDCSSLTQIEIPSSVTTIGDYAFFRCILLEKISVLSSVTSIGNNAFCHCRSLIQISMPSVKSIGENAFGECSKLEKVSIQPTFSKIENHTFSNCSSLVEFSIPSSVTSIGDYSFNSCSSLAKIEIPSSVTSIGDGAFRFCSSLTRVDVPSSVKSIGSGAFYYCTSLTELSIPSVVYKYLFMVPSSLKNYLTAKHLGIESYTKLTII